jgi:hypothetical protein
MRRLLLALVVAAATLLAQPAVIVDARPGDWDIRWSPMARSPFGAHLPAAAWTGNALVAVDPIVGRSARYDPDADVWTDLGVAPSPFSPFDPSAWTGSELLIFPNRLDGDPLALDPEAGTWRLLSSMPDEMYFPPEVAAWTGNEVVVAGGSPPQAAVYRPADDTWKSLARPGGLWVIGLTWTGSSVLAETQGMGDEGPISIARLDPGTMEWTPAAVGTVSPAAGRGLWVDGVLAYLRTDDEVAGPSSDAIYDPVGDEWRPLSAGCGVHTIDAVAAGPLIVDGSGRAAMDVRSGECVRLKRPASGIYGGGARVWTGDEALFWSGIASLDGPARPRGTRLVIDAGTSIDPRPDSR